MVRAKGAFRVTTLIAVALMVLGVALSAVSCGQPGKIYGDIVWDPSTLYYSIGGGFPTSGLSYGASYLISAGSWTYKYYIYYGGYYYPGGYSYPAYYYTGTYTVAAESGSFPFVNGSDNYFELYCSYNGMVKSGAVSSIPPANGSVPTVTPQLGTQSWTQNGLRITVTNNVAKITPEDLAQMNQAVRK
jgi:hypothetical protein